MPSHLALHSKGGLGEKITAESYCTQQLELKTLGSPQNA